MMNDGGVSQGHQPVGRWTGSVLDPAYLPSRMDAQGDPVDPPRTRLLARIAAQRALLDILGVPVYMNVTYLLAPHGRFLGEFRYGGNPVKWSVWAPHRALLLDIFPSTLPDDDELRAREGFAQEHGLRYLVTPPGYTLSLDDLRGALAGPSPRQEFANV